MHEPKVSIVIPCYNREKYLGLAMQSVLDQTYQDFELIVVDDGSIDSSVAIARAFATSDSRVRVVAEKENRGPAFALKAGFDNARGEFVGQVDSDDLLEPRALELTVRELEGDPGMGLLYTNYIEIDEDGNKLRVGSRCSTPYSKERLLTNFMTFHFRLMRRSVYVKTGGINTKFNTIEDYELCLRISEVTRIGKINDFLYLYRNHSNSVKSNSSLAMLVLSHKAIQQALKRRGMDKTHKICISNPQVYITEIQGVDYFKNRYQPKYPPPE